MKESINITIIDREDKPHEIEVPLGVGLNLMEVAVIYTFVKNRYFAKKLFYLQVAVLIYKHKERRNRYLAKK